MPQEEQDDLFDYFCRYGQYDKDGKPVGIFTKSGGSHDDAALDVDWNAHRAAVAKRSVVEAAPDEPAAPDERVTAAVDWMAPLPPS